MTIAGLPPGGQGGFAYLWLLFAIAGMGLLLATAAGVLETTIRREREADLLFIGNQFRQAIAAYRACPTAGGGHEYPVRLEDLLDDQRHATPRRHLRRLYRDPMNGGVGWGLVMAGDRIVGVHSLAEGKPLRTAFAERDAALAGAADYRGWRFVVDGDAPPRTMECR